MATSNIINENFINNIMTLEYLCGPPCLDLAIKFLIKKDKKYKFKPGKHIINGISYTLLNGDHFNNNVSPRYKEYKNDIEKVGVIYWTNSRLFNRK